MAVNLFPDCPPSDPVESALAYWRGDDFCFCCHEEDCSYEIAYHPNYCYLEVPEHGYIAKLWKDGSWGTYLPEVPGEHIKPYVPNENERLFWQQMSKCYRELPDWFTTPWEEMGKVSGSKTCCCSIEVILSKGCQCGGV